MGRNILWNSGVVNGEVLSGQQKEIFNMRLLFKNRIWHMLINELFETRKTLGSRVLCPFFLDYCIF